MNLITLQAIIIICVQLLGGAVMIFSIWISWRQLKLQQTEVIQQNKKIIELLEAIKEK